MELRRWQVALLLGFAIAVVGGWLLVREQEHQRLRYALKRPKMISRPVAASTPMDRCAPRPIDTHPLKKHLKKVPPGCPGWDDYQPGIANLTIGGVKINIPRKYFGFDRNASDGPATGANLDFHYPDMEPLARRRDGTILVLLHDTSVSTLPMEGLRKSSYDAYSRYGYAMRRKIKVDSIFDEVMQLNSYKIGGTRTYFEGNIENPKYWLECDDRPQAAGCNYDFPINRSIKLKYSFNYHDVDRVYHRDIYKKILFKINSFIENPKDRFQGDE